DGDERVGAVSRAGQVRAVADEALRRDPAAAAGPGAGRDPEADRKGPGGVQVAAAEEEDDEGVVPSVIPSGSEGPLSSPRMRVGRAAALKGVPRRCAPRDDRATRLP